MTGHWSKEEDKGYRRGWDQGVAALAYALGIDNEILQRLAWKERCRAFRNYRLEEAPDVATDEEKAELRQAFGVMN